MLVDQFDELMESRPFQPFRIYMSDGKSVMVKSPEFAWHAPASRIVWVASTRGNERVHMVDLHLVTRFTVNPPGGNGRRRRSR
jgi:hypothetical protein